MTTQSSSTEDGSRWLSCRELIYGGLQRKFSAAEMARAGMQPWPRRFDQYLLINVAVMLAVFFFFATQRQFGVTTIVMTAGTVGGLWAARIIWREPSFARFNWASVAAGLTGGAAYVISKRLLSSGDLRTFQLFMVCAAMVQVLALWFLALYRIQQIEARLRELDEQERSLQMAQRLATAQIQPHFLFNTLASIQHWVDTGDARAGACLRAFTDYLRATLPMFERQTVALDEELQVVRRYLEVMQARLGERLQWSIDVPAAGPAVPPGLVLTLVENAVAHGIEPSLRGGSIRIQGLAEPGVLAFLLRVEDDGAGLAAEARDGLGLSNTRQRLTRQFGVSAELRLEARPGGGCVAALRLPLNDKETT